MNPTIEELTAVVEQEAKKWPEVLRLMTHPGVGSLTALAFVLRSSELRTVPLWQADPQRRRADPFPRTPVPAINGWGHITKQGSSLLRFLLVEAAQAAARWDSECCRRRRYMHLAMRRQGSIAKVAMARRLAVRLYWMLAERLGVFAVGRIRFERGTALAYRDMA